VPEGGMLNGGSFTTIIRQVMGGGCLWEAWSRSSRPGCWILWVWVN
jgi:hypothetical protein